MNAAFACFDVNTAGRDYVVGDIHGCFHLLDALLEYLSFDDARDRLFSVGDLVDRGPDSPRALTFLDAPWFHAIRGNHEQMLLDAVHEGGQAEMLWRMNGGDWFAGLDEARARAFVEHASRLPHAIEVALADGGIAGFVHGQMPLPDWTALRRGLKKEPLNEELAATLLWDRTSANEVEARHRGTRPRLPVAIRNVDVVFFGHTPIPEPRAVENTRWLDTGAFIGWSLSIAELAVDGTVWSVGEDGRPYDRGWRRLADDPRR